MKKSIINSIFLCAAFACLVGFSSCHDDIYGAINNEIKLNSSGLQGDMHSIVHYKNYILTCNGEIFYKTNKLHPKQDVTMGNGISQLPLLQKKATTEFLPQHIFLQPTVNIFTR